MPRRRRVAKARADRLAGDGLMDLTYGRMAGRQVFASEDDRRAAYESHRDELLGRDRPAEAAARYDTDPAVVRACVEAWADRHLRHSVFYGIDEATARRAVTAARRRKRPGPTAIELLDRYGLPWRPDPRAVTPAP